jgi:hypothetical protein
MDNRPGDKSMDWQYLKSDLELLKNQKIYFGHQSVGKNIMAGVEDIFKQLDFKGWPVIDLDQVTELPAAYFLHSRIGANIDPKGKCLHFTELLNKQIDKNIDIAFIKFCYVDIDENTDVVNLFTHYKSTMDSLQNEYPAISFLHVTVPLMASPGGWKIHLKRLIYYPDYTDPANIKRNEFNQQLLATYSEEKIFDLAGLESTYRDNKRNSFKKNGQLYYTLIREYTSDGGHLNETGRKWIAAGLLQKLARTVKANRNRE